MPRSTSTSDQNPRLASALACLEGADETLLSAGIVRRSLAPGRDTATSLCELGRRLEHLMPHGCEQAFASGLASIALAELRNFPDNIFWDFDFTAASLLRNAQRAAEPGENLRTVCELIVSLQDLFGGGTQIRFRYGHDFIYGFDWAKWVRKAPAERAHVGPFELEFLTFLHARGLELLALIDANDAKYPRLVDERARNPFAFSREPSSEAALHQRLAKERKLPVESWLIDATPTWDRPFQRLRLECAQTLGLAQASA